MERLVEHDEQRRPRLPRASAPTSRAAPPARSSRLSADFNRMLERLEHERRESGRAVLRAQEQERSRIAQDLHDEVNQALTAILLRLQATICDAPPAPAGGAARDARRSPRRRWRSCCTSPASCARPRSTTTASCPRSPRRSPTSASAPASARRFRRHGALPPLSDEEQLVIYRVTQESLSNVAQHAGRPARRRRAVVRRPHGAARARRRRGLQPRPTNGRARLGVSGMRERALLVGGNLTIFSEPGDGTTIELTMGAT